MKRASYRDAIFWIAVNDGNGEEDRTDPQEVRKRISVRLIAEIFQVSPAKVGLDVAKKRLQHDWDDDNDVCSN